MFYISLLSYNKRIFIVYFKLKQRFEYYCFNEDSLFKSLSI
jgi:hypothetical protein